mmetsp:Transcript_25552/g.73779  ORF Transcript_25552/g.73779 Transcript_25552/m.73779 type:complete len:300 (+) Transcript_25552:553-1452(+)
MPPLRRPGHSQRSPRADGRRDAREVCTVPADAPGSDGQGVPELQLPLQARRGRGGKSDRRDGVQQVRRRLLLLPLQRPRGPALRRVPEGDCEAGEAERARGNAGYQGLSGMRHHDREDWWVQPYDMSALRLRLVLDLHGEAGGRAGSRLRALPCWWPRGLQAVRRFRPTQPFGVPAEVPRHPCAALVRHPVPGPRSHDAGVAASRFHLLGALPSVFPAIRVHGVRAALRRQPRLRALRGLPALLDPLLGAHLAAPEAVRGGVRTPRLPDAGAFRLGSASDSRNPSLARSPCSPSLSTVR